MRPAKESLWTWLADVAMPGVTVPSLLLSWGLVYWFQIPFIQAMLWSVLIVVVMITTGVILWGNRRARQKAEMEDSVSGKVRDA